MNGRIVLAASTFLTLAACQSADQLEQKPPTWTAIYQAHWEPMANCIVARSQGPLVAVTPTFSPGRAQIVTKNPAGGVLGTFDVRQVSGNATEVAYRSIYGGPDTDAGGGARNIADRCARP
jgi:hypothetical protein